MERSLESLTYKGSIAEAILEAKKQKRLFVVYISGEDAESKNIENSVWTDSKVEESLSKYCILLHVQEGSADALNFSAIYPQKSVPSITAIGFNGVQVWQTEGPVNAEFLASALEKAWLSLHIQETTASFLTAALASKKNETSASGVSNVTESEQGSSSIATAPSSAPEPSAASLVHEKDHDSEMGAKGKNAKLGDETSSKSTTSNSVYVGKEVKSVMVGPDSSKCNEMPAKNDDLTPVKSSNHFSAVPVKNSKSITEKRSKDVPSETFEGSNSREVGESDGNLSVDRPAEVHLNIKLPDGSNLQKKFPLEHTLTMVKDYVDKNQASDVGSYDLAIPYPRKVFSGQDLHKSLYELGLFNRQALIVVPHQKPSGFNREKSASSVQMNTTTVSSSSGSDEGYFSYIKRVLSFMNPFSYLGRGASSSSAAQESESGIWQYNPNPALRNNISGTERSYPPNQGTSRGRNDSRTRRLATSGFGSNIHTLKHDEDERFGDKNPFWNGNSTQYGGNNDGK